jgi:hypothetical protein
VYRPVIKNYFFFIYFRHWIKFFREDNHFFVNAKKHNYELSISSILRIIFSILRIIFSIVSSLSVPSMINDANAAVRREFQLIIGAAVWLRVEKFWLSIMKAIIVIIDY